MFTPLFFKGGINLSQCEYDIQYEYGIIGLARMADPELYFY